MSCVLRNRTRKPSIFKTNYIPIQEDYLEIAENNLKFHMTYINILHDTYEEALYTAPGCPISKETVKQLFVALTNIHSHFSFLLKILTGTDVATVKNEFPNVAPFYPALNTESDISLLPLGDVLKGVVSSTLRNIRKNVEEIILDQNGNRSFKKCEETKSQITILTAKLEAIILYLPGAAVMDHGDIFTYSKNSYVWERLYKVANFRKLAEKHDIDSSLKLFCNVVVLANAVASKTHEVEKRTGSALMGKLTAALSLMYYAAVPEKALTRASLLFANPTMENAFKVWGIPDHSLVKKIFVLTLPSIGYDRKIYLPRIFPQITKESILKEYESGDQNRITPSGFQAPDLTSQKEEILSNIFIKNKERVKVRIIAPHHLNLDPNPTNGFSDKVKSAMSWIFNKIPIPGKATTKGFNGVIVHIHGGGFVSMSSSAHRGYLYQWAKSLNMVIFSIDYRLAPANPYPAGLDDVWQAYNWIVNYAENILGIPTDRVVVAGDSAGGNLAASLTLRTIKECVRVPDGCFLGYPALNLFPKKVIPSYFVSVDNNILPYNVLSLCLKAYIPEEFKPESDPFLSPLVASNELMSKMPAVRMVTGNDDPLHDDNWKLLNRLLDLGKDVGMTVYEGAPHGFLTMNDLVAYEVLIDDTVDRLKELFHSVEVMKEKTPKAQPVPAEFTNL